MLKLSMLAPFDATVCTLVLPGETLIHTMTLTFALTADDKCEPLQYSPLPSWAELQQMQPQHLILPVNDGVPVAHIDVEESGPVNIPPFRLCTAAKGSRLRIVFALVESGSIVRALLMTDAFTCKTRAILEQGKISGKRPRPPIDLASAEKCIDGNLHVRGHLTVDGGITGDSIHGNEIRSRFPF